MEARGASGRDEDRPRQEVRLKERGDWLDAEIPIKRPTSIDRREHDRANAEPDLRAERSDATLT